MQFQVPQFIETEDKIVGPFSLRQFIYIAGAGIISFVLFFVLQIWLWVIIVLILGSFSTAMALVRINGRPMSVFVTSAFGYIWSPRVYTLKPNTAQTEPVKIKQGIPKKIPVLGGIKSLLEKMNTSKDTIPKREKTIAPNNFGLSQKEIKERYQVIMRTTGEREMARRIDYK